MRDTTTVDRDYPQMAAEQNQVEPAPRRVRAQFGGQQIFDTIHARYVWEWPYYPQYYIPIADVDQRFLVDEGHEQHLARGIARRKGLRVGDQERPGTVRVFGEDALDGIAGTVRFDWDAMDAWFEEDEQIFVHPRNPYVRVDALRSHRHVRVEVEGAVLAESGTPVLLFETGLPTRYYFDRSEVAFDHLVRTSTQTACPYKGVTSDYWAVKIGGEVSENYRDIAWSYNFPTRQALPITGLVAFYNERVDTYLDGAELTRPRTHFTDLFALSP